MQHGIFAGTLAQANPTCSNAPVSSLPFRFPTALFDFLQLGAEPEVAGSPFAGVAAAVVAVAKTFPETGQKRKVLPLVPIAKKKKKNQFLNS